MRAWDGAGPGGPGSTSGYPDRGSPTAPCLRPAFCLTEVHHNADCGGATTIRNCSDSSKTSNGP